MARHQGTDGGGYTSRGRALRTAWTDNDATIVAYMDVDLSTGLDALLPLVAPLVSGHSDVAIGTRLARGSRVVGLDVTFAMTAPRSRPGQVA